MTGAYFEGWYFKYQCQEGIFAFIPAFHTDENGNCSASVQAVTENGAWYFEYPMSECHVKKGIPDVRIGKNHFTEKGCEIYLENDEMKITGHLVHGELGKIKGDIMGIFRFVPFMQCRHGVLSMYHKVQGSLSINGKKTVVKGTGYIESDRGNSFPKHYLWTQCILDEEEGSSLMLSVAEIPMCGFHFCGCICEIWHGDWVYRIATYKGCRIKEYRDGSILVKQGIYRLKVTKLTEKSFKLHAPVMGNMSRMIKESPSCAVRYQFFRGKKKIFDITNSRASFEQA